MAGPPMSTFSTHLDTQSFNYYLAALLRIRFKIGAFGNGGTKWIEVDTHQIDGCNRVGDELSLVFGIAAHSEKTTMH